MSEVGKLVSCKVFGISPQQITSSVFGQPLAEIPINRLVLNLIGTAFCSTDLAYLAQCCGELLRRLSSSSAARQMVLDKAREFMALEGSAACYLELNSSLVILLPPQCLGLNAEEISKLLTTYFLELELLQELLQETS
jgi:hypothetical protein